MMNLLQKNGFRVVGLNVPMEIILDRNFNLEHWLANFQGVRLIAIDLHWYEHSFGAMDVARICKQVLPNVPVVLGGLTASYYAQQILAQFPVVDFVIRGDGERPLLELTQHLCRDGSGEMSRIANLSFRIGDEIIHNLQDYVATTADLDALNFVDLDFMIHTQEYAGLQYSSSERVDFSGYTPLKGHWLTIGRGCHFDCSFCGGGKNAQQIICGRDGIIQRSVSRVVDDLQRMQEMGIKQVSFNLDPAIMGAEFWSGLFSEMQRRRIKIGVYNECFQLPSMEFLDAFVETVDLDHSELAFTPLTGSERVRRMNGKFFTNAGFMEVLNKLKVHRLPVFVYFSLNVPGENRKTFRRTLRMAYDICTNYPDDCLRMINMCHTVDPSCPMSIEPDTYEIGLDFATFADYYNYCRETPVLRPDVVLDEWRGYKAVNALPRSLEKMAQQWNGFSMRQKAQCYPIPRTW